MDASPFEFSGLSASSPLVWLAKGWAVLSGPSMPIIAEGAEEPNDTYVPQLVGAQPHTGFFFIIFLFYTRRACLFVCGFAP